MTDRLPDESRVVTGTDLTTDGRGVARDEGKVLFVPGLLPGERARVHVTRTHRSYAEAETDELLEPAPDRILPFCPSFGVCGGCDLQHWRYASQLAWKQKRVTDALTRIGGMEDLSGVLLPATGMDDAMRYRYKCDMPVRSNGIGFFRRGSDRVEPVPECGVLPPPFPDLRDAVWHWMAHSGIPAWDPATRAGAIRHLTIRMSRATGQTLVLLHTTHHPEDGWPEIQELATRLGDILAGHGHCLAGLLVQDAPDRSGKQPDPVLLWGQDTLMEELDGLRFRVSATSFFQINPEMSAQLLDTAARWAVPDGVKAEKVVDLYCGTGSISCFLARRADQVLGIESSESAVEDARENMRINDMEEQLVFRAGQAETVLQPDDLDQETVVVLDPPRRGCDPKVLALLLERLPERIVYVSCDPATLARDVKTLCGGPYEVERVQLFDMFPWTGHVECVTLMSRVKE